MQFTFDAPAPNPDIAALERMLTDLDPAALLDLDASGRHVRISTVLRMAEVLACLRDAGLAPDPDRLHQLPSQCCGGCSG
jgi:hypothetical protein